jgi:hypothetical protein
MGNKKKKKLSAQHIELVDKVRQELEEKTRVGKEGEALSVLIPTTHGTYFRGVNICQ